MKKPGSNRSLSQFTEDLKQNWLQNTYQQHYTDQFGFKITYGNRVTLYHQDTELVTVNCLAAAKEISRVYLNDMIIGGEKKEPKRTAY